MKQLQTKESAGWVNDDGTVIAPHTLYRFVDENGRGGCWYAKIENAERSWKRAHPVAS